MAKHITDPPNSGYDFGYDFNYENWDANTSLTFTNVPWDSSYRNVWAADSDAALNAWIDDRSTSNLRIDKAAYSVLGRPVKVAVPFNRMMRYNYLRASNPAQPIPGGDTPRDYYYFVTGVVRNAPNSTMVTLELDVWQTFIRHTSIGRSYLEKGHLGIAASNAWANYGMDYLTVPESMDLGAEMQTIAYASETVMRAFQTGQSGPGTIQGMRMNYDVLVVSTIDLEKDYGDEIKPEAAKGGGAQFMSSGATLYVLPTIGDNPDTDISYDAWLSSLADKPWIAQGIISVTLVPRIRRYAPDFQYNTDKPTRISQTYIAPKQYNMLTNWRDNEVIRNMIPARYRHLRKLYTFPYMCIEMTTSTGTAVILRPEAWNHPHARVMERPAYMPPGQRVNFYPRGYNSLQSQSEYQSLYSTGPGANAGDGDDFGDYLGVFTSISVFPQVPAINDAAALAIANTRSSTAQARSAADWSQQLAGAAAQNTLEAGERGIHGSSLTMDMAQEAQRKNLALSHGLANDTAVLDGLAGVGSGLVGGLTGGLPGAAVGGGGAAVGAMLGGVSRGMAQNTENLQMSTSQVAERDINRTGGIIASQTLHANKSLADFASKGNYEQTIAAIDAKVQDLQMTPPSMLGQYAGESHQFVHDGLGVALRWKLINSGALARVCEHWLRYGYNVHRAIVPPQNLKCMTKFTYWKFLEVELTQGRMPEFYKAAIRGILEKGVTVWSSPDDIGVIDAANNSPLSGITI